MAEDEHRGTLLPLLQGPAMEVIANSRENTANWIIPKALLSHHFEFFRAACNRPFKEGIENKIILPNCHLKAFQGFVHWLYFGALPTWIGDHGGVYGSFGFWVLGDRLLVRGFKNAAMQDLYDKYAHGEDEAYIHVFEIYYCWKYTTDKSALRRFILDLVSSAWKKHYQRYGQWEWMDLFETIPDFGNKLLCCRGSGQVKGTSGDYFQETENTAFDELDAVEL